uniref:OTU domain-containing protein n=1 Tax=Timema bartmani TaxID=61472 RepID=A0A7R9HW24_9NEOP|nr:unnamed protein product [Timema bartmani]
MSSSPKILGGVCPDEGCQAKVMFPSYEASVECNRCGQRFQAASIKNVAEVKDQAVALRTVLRSLISSSNPGLKKGPEMVKVLGLSHYHCKLLSPLLTHYGMDKKTSKAKPIGEMTQRGTFDCSVLGDRGFRIDSQHIDVPGYGRDVSGSANYLAGTLLLIKTTNGNRETLIPIHADGDGHCLVHAVSRALVGRELFWHPLRTNLKDHILQNIDKYKKLFQDFINASEWMGIIEECDPEYEPFDEGEILGLRNIHVFGLANVLKRPIILLDSVAGMKSSGDYSAVFLPVLVSPDECRGKSGEMNKPLCLAWSSSARNHYIPLVGIKGDSPPRLSRNILPKVWAVPQALLDKYIEFDSRDCLIVGGEKGLQDSYIRKLTASMDELFLQKYGIHPALVADVQHFCFRKLAGVLNMKTSLVVTYAQSIVSEQRVYRCLSCEALNSEPFITEWLRPGVNGLLYNLALEHFGPLREDKVYNFHNYGVTCSYDSRKDVLVITSSKPFDTCKWCQDTRLRMIHCNGSVDYENGDATSSLSPSSTGPCHCGYKHWWNGLEYDNLPQIIPVVLSWAGRVITERMPWFQNESNSYVNSNAFQMASFLVHKHFPGEFGSEPLIQKVVDQILELTKKPEQLGDVKDYGGSMSEAEDYLPVLTKSNGKKPPRGRLVETQTPRPSGDRKRQAKPATVTSSEYVDHERPPDPPHFEGPISVPGPGHKDHSKKLAAMTNISKKFDSDNQQPDGSTHEDEEMLLQKTQQELQNQRKEYIQRKEREYKKLLHRHIVQPTKHARPQQDPGRDILQLGGSRFAYEPTHRRIEPSFIPGHRTVRMGPGLGYSLATPPQKMPRRSFPEDHRPIAQNPRLPAILQEARLANPHDPILAAQAADVLRNLLSKINRDPNSMPSTSSEATDMPSTSTSAMVLATNATNLALNSELPPSVPSSSNMTNVHSVAGPSRMGSMCAQLDSDSSSPGQDSCEDSTDMVELVQTDSLDVAKGTIGHKYANLKFSAAISPQLLSSIVPETCEAICICLKKYIKNQQLLNTKFNVSGRHFRFFSVPYHHSGLAAASGEVSGPSSPRHEGGKEESAEQINTKPVPS